MGVTSLHDALQEKDMNKISDHLKDLLKNADTAGGGAALVSAAMGTVVASCIPQHASFLSPFFFSSSGLRRFNRDIGGPAA